MRSRNAKAVIVKSSIINPCNKIRSSSIPDPVIAGDERVDID
jgi:hypothetical protein